MRTRPHFAQHLLPYGNLGRFISRRNLSGRPTALTGLRILLSALAAIPVISTLDRPSVAEQLGPKVAEREVIEEDGRAITIYEVVTGSTSGVVPRTVRVTRHRSKAASPQHEEDAIQRYCENQPDADRLVLESCKQQQQAALRQVTEVAKAVENDAGLTNIVQTCMSGSTREGDLDWLAVKQCYDEQRRAFARLYGR